MAALGKSEMDGKGREKEEDLEIGRSKEEKPKKILLVEINPHLTCYLCKGYLIDATTISECLHSFCRSCVIKFLQENSYCPVCEVVINKAKPNLKLDKTLQDIVYKLVPGLFQSEMRRRQLFYQKHPEMALKMSPEQRGVDTERIIYSPRDLISLSLEHISDELTPKLFVLTAQQNTDLSNNNTILGQKDCVENPTKRYLQCPGMCTVGVLKKFVLNKYNVDQGKFQIDVLHKMVPLPDHYTLIDVAYIYSWKRNEPLKFFYRITDLNLLNKHFAYIPSTMTTFAENHHQQIRNNHNNKKNCCNENGLKVQASVQKTKICAEKRDGLLLKFGGQNVDNGFKTPGSDRSKLIKALDKEIEKVSNNKNKLIKALDREIEKVSNHKNKNGLDLVVRKPSRSRKKPSKAELRLEAKIAKMDDLSLKTSDSKFRASNGNLKMSGSERKFSGSETNLVGSEINFRGSEVSFKGSEIKCKGSEMSCKGSEPNWRGNEPKLRRSETGLKVNQTSLGGRESSLKVNEDKWRMNETNLRQTNERSLKETSRPKETNDSKLGAKESTWKANGTSWRRNETAFKIPDSSLKLNDTDLKMQIGTEETALKVSVVPESCDEAKSNFLKNIELTPKPRSAAQKRKNPSPIRRPSPKKPRTQENADLKLLFDNCNINIPSSLSITIKESGEDGKHPHAAIRPVQNYIEILKLPETKTEDAQKRLLVDTSKAPHVPCNVMPTKEVGPKTFQRMFEESVRKAALNKRTKPDQSDAANKPLPEITKEVAPHQQGKVAIPRLKPAKQLPNLLPPKQHPSLNLDQTIANMRSTTLGLNYTVSIQQQQQPQTPPKNVNFGKTETNQNGVGVNPMAIMKPLSVVLNPHQGTVAGSNLLMLRSEASSETTSNNVQNTQKCDKNASRSPSNVDQQKPKSAQQVPPAQGRQNGQVPGRKLAPNSPRNAHVEQKSPKTPQKLAKLPKFEQPSPQIEQQLLKLGQQLPNFEQRLCKVPHASKFEQKSAKLPQKSPKLELEQQSSPFGQQSSQFEQKLPTFEQQLSKLEQQPCKVEQQKSPKLLQMSPKFERKSSQFEKQSLQFEHPVSQCQQLPKVEQQSPKELQSNKFEHQASKFKQQSPKFEQQSPKFEQQSPKSEQQSPKFEQQPRKFEQGSARNERKSPKVQRQPPKPEQQLLKFEQPIKFEQQSSKFEQQPSKLDQPSSILGLQSPKFEQQLSKFGLHSPKIEPISPKNELQSPKFGQKSPKNELQSPKFEQQLAKFEQKSPKFEQKSPKLEHKSPKFEQQSPRSEQSLKIEQELHRALNHDQKSPKTDQKSPKTDQFLPKPLSELEQKCAPKPLCFDLKHDQKSPKFEQPISPLQQNRNKVNIISSHLISSATNATEKKRNGGVPETDEKMSEIIGSAAEGCRTAEISSGSELSTTQLIANLTDALRSKVEATNKQRTSPTKNNHHPSDVEAGSHLASTPSSKSPLNLSKSPLNLTSPSSNLTGSSSNLTGSLANLTGSSSNLSGSSSNSNSSSSNLSSFPSNLSNFPPTLSSSLSKSSSSLSKSSPNSIKGFSNLTKSVPNVIKHRPKVVKSVLKLPKAHPMLTNLQMMKDHEVSTSSSATQSKPGCREVREIAPKPESSLSPNQLLEKYNIQNLAQLTANINLRNSFNLSAAQMALLKHFEQQNHQNWLACFGAAAQKLSNAKEN